MAKRGHEAQRVGRSGRADEIAGSVRALLGALDPDLRDDVIARLRADLGTAAEPVPAVAPAPASPRGPKPLPEPAPSRRKSGSDSTARDPDPDSDPATKADLEPVGRPLPFADGGAEREADLAVDALEDDEALLARTATWPRERWRALLRCVHRVLVARFATLGQDGLDAAALGSAVARCARETLAAVRRDPAAWMERTCGASTSMPEQRAPAPGAASAPTPAPRLAAPEELAGPPAPSPQKRRRAGKSPLR